MFTIQCLVDMIINAYFKLNPLMCNYFYLDLYSQLLIVSEEFQDCRNLYSN